MDTDPEDRKLITYGIIVLVLVLGFAAYGHYKESIDLWLYEWRHKEAAPAPTKWDLIREADRRDRGWGQEPDPYRVLAAVAEDQERHAWIIGGGIASAGLMVAIAIIIYGRRGSRGER